MAGDNLPSAFDNQQQYRPREIPANRPVRPLRGRCSRYFTALIKYVLRPIVTFLPSRPLQSRLERVCSRGEGSRGPWDLTGPTSLQSGFYAHLGQANRASGNRPGCQTPATPAPANFFPPLLGRELRRNVSRKEGAVNPTFASRTTYLE